MHILPNNPLDRKTTITKLALIGFLYPVWGLFVYFVLPNEYQSVVSRTIVGALTLVCAFCFHKIPKLENYGADIINGVILIMTIHFVTIVYLSGVSNVFTIGMIVYTTATCGVVSSSRFHFLFALFYILGPAIACWMAGAPKENSVMLIASMMTLAFIFSIILMAKEKLQLELLENQAALDASKQLATLSQFASGVAHELNNPLTVTLGRGELLMRMLKSEPPVDRAKGIEHCEKIISMSKRAGKIASSMMTGSNAYALATISAASLGF